MAFWKSILRLLSSTPTDTDSLVKKAIKSVCPNLKSAFQLGYEQLGNDSVDRFRRYVDTTDLPALMHRESFTYNHDGIKSYLVVEGDGTLSFVVLVDPAEYLFDPYVVCLRQGVVIPDGILREITIPENEVK